MYFCANEFETGVNDSIFSGNEQQKGVNSVGRALAPVFCTHCKLAEKNLIAPSDTGIAGVTVIWVSQNLEYPRT